MVVVGQKEASENLVAVRSHKDGDLGVMRVEDFKEKVLEEIDNKIK